MNKKRLNENEVKQYVQAGGVKCPFCGSEDVEGGSMDVDTGYVSQEVTCLECDSTWNDLYKLIDVVEIEEVTR